jgi:hypothetical protein
MTDSNGDGWLTADEVASKVVPLLFGVQARAVSYRHPLEQLLRSEDYAVSFVGNSCRACSTAASRFSVYLLY